MVKKIKRQENHGPHSYGHWQCEVCKICHALLTLLHQHCIGVAYNSVGVRHID